MSMAREITAASSSDPVSQRDIARHFGVSHVTVSLALRNSTRVSKDLGDRIRDHAEAVGYRRDPVLFALAAYRHRKSCVSVRGAIAWINAWQSPEELRSHPEIERYWRGASAAAMEAGYRLEEFRLGSELAPGRLHQVLETRNIRGILLPPHAPGTRWNGFPWEDYSIVRFGRGDEGPRGHQVMPGAAANVALALRKMRERGCRRIGCLTGGSILRQAGYCMEDSLPMVQRKLAADRGVFFLDLANVPPRSVAPAIRRWITSHQIEAVLADDAVLGQTIKLAGFSIPGDVALATLARGEEAGINPESEEIGRTAIHMLDALMRERHPGLPRLMRQVAVEGTWVDGSTLPRVAESPIL